MLEFACSCVICMYVSILQVILARETLFLALRLDLNTVHPSFNISDPILTSKSSFTSVYASMFSEQLSVFIT